jgi:hypothetical protein
LLRGSVCKTFVHQFAVIAKRKPPTQKRKGGFWGDSGERQPFRRWAKPNCKLGLAAVKHAQQVAKRGALSERYEKASSALAAVQATARAEWPEAMKREIQACRTTEQQRVWSEKWAAYLAGASWRRVRRSDLRAAAVSRAAGVSRRDWTEWTLCDR